MADSGWGEAPDAEYMQVPEPQGLGAPFQAATIPQMGGIGDGKKLTGTVKKWFNDKGFGFITKDDGNDVFVHHSSIHAEGKASLDIGETVEFNVISGDDGREKAAVVTGPGGVYVKGCTDLYGGGGGGGSGKVCYNFQNTGQCRFGTSCRFSHVDGGAEAFSGSGSGGYGGGYGGGRGLWWQREKRIRKWGRIRWRRKPRRWWQLWRWWKETLLQLPKQRKL